LICFYITLCTAKGIGTGVKVGIFGGTFNPPHIGHVQSAIAAAKQLKLDVVHVIPAGLPPHKALPEGTPSADIRLFMTRSAFRDVENVVVSSIETDKTEPSYTADTVMRIKQSYLDAEIFLLVGTDMFLTIETWKDSAQLLKYATPAVFPRSPGDLEKIREYSMTIRK